MIEIHTIDAFQALNRTQQGEILKAIQAKQKLMSWLEGLNSDGEGDEVSQWVKCKSCHPDNPGWRWREVRDNSGIHPSQIDKCVATMWFSCSGYHRQKEDLVDSRLRLIFDLGTAAHDFIFQRYGKMGVWSRPEDYWPEAAIDPDAKNDKGELLQPTSNQYMLRGHADALITSELEVVGMGQVSLRTIHEYKTINDNGFSNLNRPQASHRKQATVYAAALNVPIVVYLYLNKNNSDIKDFPIPFDDAVWEEITSTMELALHHVREKTRVPWEFTSAVKYPRECMTCGYRKLCKPPI